MSRAPSIAALLLLAGGCTVDELQLEDRWCDPDYPCAGGYACVGNKCVASSTDAPPVTDLRPSPDSDGPEADQARLDRPGPQGDAPGPDGDLGAAVDLLADLPALDGCPAGMTPCNGLCVDLLTDLNHCGSCNQACGPEADRCENGNCHCDHNKPICLNGLSCVNAKCVCVSGANSLCLGCCEGSTQCAPGNTISACGAQPNQCSVCSTSNPCLTPICSSLTHTCTTAVKLNGTSCVTGGTSGRCYSGGCCTGCWNAQTSSCLLGTSITACGTGGNACLTCAAGYICSAGKCVVASP